jgi:hypothetical protein
MALGTQAQARGKIMDDHSPFRVERLRYSANQRTTVFRVSDRACSNSSVRFGEILVRDGNDPRASISVKVKQSEARTP